MEAFEMKRLHAVFVGTVDSGKTCGWVSEKPRVMKNLLADVKTQKLTYFLSSHNAQLNNGKCTYCTGWAKLSDTTLHFCL